MEKYSIHKLEKTDFEQLVPLMKNCFGMNIDVDYFKWKYFDNPSGFVEGYYAKDLETGEMAAYYGGIPQTFSYKDKSFKVVQSCDTMTHSNHRRNGLFEKLAKHCDSELLKRNELFIIGFGGSKTAPGYVKYGWKLLFDVRNYFLLPFQMKLFFSNELKDTFFATELEVKDVSALLVKNYDGIQDSLLIDRSIVNYTWRLKNPLHKYHIVGAKNKNGVIASYLVYYLDGAKIVLFDFYFSTNNEAKFLIKSVWNLENVNLKIQGVISFCQHNSYWSKQLSKIGFTSNPFSKGPLSEKMYFVINAQEQENINLFNPDVWNLNSFDHDCL